MTTIWGKDIRCPCGQALRDVAPNYVLAGTRPTGEWVRSSTLQAHCADGHLLKLECTSTEDECTVKTQRAP